MGVSRGWGYLGQWLEGWVGVCLRPSGGGQAGWAGRQRGSVRGGELDC